MTRRRLPHTRPSITHKVEIDGADLYLTAGYYPDNGDIGEVFLSIGKQGSTMKGLLDSWAIMMSLAAQHDDVEEFEAILLRFKGVSFPPAGFTSNPEQPSCTSLIDYVVNWLGAHRRYNIQQPVPAAGEDEPGAKTDG